MYNGLGDYTKILEGSSGGLASTLTYEQQQSIDSILKSVKSQYEAGNKDMLTQLLGDKGIETALLKESILRDIQANPGKYKKDVEKEGDSWGKTILRWLGNVASSVVTMATVGSILAAISGHSFTEQYEKAKQGFSDIAAWWNKGNAKKIAEKVATENAQKQFVDSVPTSILTENTEQVQNQPQEETVDKTASKTVDISTAYINNKDKQVREDYKSLITLGNKLHDAISIDTTNGDALELANKIIDIQQLQSEKNIQSNAQVFSMVNKNLDYATENFKKLFTINTSEDGLLGIIKKSAELERVMYDTKIQESNLMVNIANEITQDMRNRMIGFISNDKSVATIQNIAKQAYDLESEIVKKQGENNAVVLKALDDKQNFILDLINNITRVDPTDTVLTLTKKSEELQKVITDNAFAKSSKVSNFLQSRVDFLADTINQYVDNDKIDESLIEMTNDILNTTRKINDKQNKNNAFIKQMYSKNIDDVYSLIDNYISNDPSESLLNITKKAYDVERLLQDKRVTSNERLANAFSNHLDGLYKKIGDFSSIEVNAQNVFDKFKETENALDSFKVERSNNITKLLEKRMKSIENKAKKIKVDINKLKKKHDTIFDETKKGEVEVEDENIDDESENENIDLTQQTEDSSKRSKEDYLDEAANDFDVDEKPVEKAKDVSIDSVRGFEGQNNQMEVETIDNSTNSIVIPNNNSSHVNITNSTSIPSNTNIENNTEETKQEDSLSQKEIKEGHEQGLSTDESILINFAKLTTSDPSILNDTIAEGEKEGFKIDSSGLVVSDKNQMSITHDDLTNIFKKNYASIRLKPFSLEEQEKSNFIKTMINQYKTLKILRGDIAFEPNESDFVNGIVCGVNSVIDTIPNLSTTSRKNMVLSIDSYGLKLLLDTYENDGIDISMCNEATRLLHGVVFRPSRRDGISIQPDSNGNSDFTKFLHNVYKMYKSGHNSWQNIAGAVAKYGTQNVDSNQFFKVIPSGIGWHVLSQLGMETAPNIDFSHLGQPVVNGDPKTSIGKELAARNTFIIDPTQDVSIMYTYGQLEKAKGSTVSGSNAIKAIGSNFWGHSIMGASNNKTLLDIQKMANDFNTNLTREFGTPAVEDGYIDALTELAKDGKSADINLQIDEKGKLQVLVQNADASKRADTYLGYAGGTLMLLSTVVGAGLMIASPFTGGVTAVPGKIVMATGNALGAAMIGTSIAATKSWEHPKLGKMSENEEKEAINMYTETVERYANQEADNLEKIAEKIYEMPEGNARTIAENDLKGRIGAVNTMKGKMTDSPYFDNFYAQQLSSARNQSNVLKKFFYGPEGRKTGWFSDSHANDTFFNEANATIYRDAKSRNLTKHFADDVMKDYPRQRELDRNLTKANKQIDEYYGSYWFSDSNKTKREADKAKLLQLRKDNKDINDKVVEDLKIADTNKRDYEREITNLNKYFEINGRNTNSTSVIDVYNRQKKRLDDMYKDGLSTEGFVDRIETEGQEKRVEKFFKPSNNTDAIRYFNNSISSADKNKRLTFSQMEDMLQSYNKSKIHDIIEFGKPFLPEGEQDQIEKDHEQYCNNLYDYSKDHGLSYKWGIDADFKRIKEMVSRAYARHVLSNSAQIKFARSHGIQPVNIEKDSKGVIKWDIPDDETSRWLQILDNTHQLMNQRIFERKEYGKRYPTIKEIEKNLNIEFNKEELDLLKYWEEHERAVNYSGIVELNYLPEDFSKTEGGGYKRKRKNKKHKPIKKKRKYN